MRFQDRLPTDTLTLAHIPTGMRVQILNMDLLPVERRDHLLAFGLNPGQWVEIKQHRPAIVAQVDHTELALEREDAVRILVENPTPGMRFRHFKRQAARGRRHLRRRFLHCGRKRRRRRFLSKLLGMKNETRR